MNPKVTVFTNDRHLWLLNGFQYLFRKYWSDTQELRVMGYAVPNNGLLDQNTSFISIARRNYSAAEWSNGVMESLDKFINQGEEFFIMMLEDYWLSEAVKHDVLQTLTEFMQNHERNILRIDLTSDRCQHNRYCTKYDTVKGCEIVRTDCKAPYQMSFQAAIWNIRLMRDVMRPYEDPWQSEIYGTNRLASLGDRLLVLGTRSHPVRYTPVYRSKRGRMDISKLTQADQNMIIKRGWM